MGRNDDRDGAADSQPGWDPINEAEQQRARTRRNEERKARRGAGPRRRRAMEKPPTVGRVIKGMGKMIKAPGKTQAERERIQANMRRGLRRIPRGG